MLLAKFVIGRVRIWVAAQPEIFDEVFPLFIILQLLECLHFLVGDDPDHILLKPFLKGAVGL